MCTMCILGTFRGQKRVSDPLGLELWTIIITFMDGFYFGIFQVSIAEDEAICSTKSGAGKFF